MALPLGDEQDRYDNTRKIAHVSKIAFPNDKMLDFVLRGDNNMEIATNKYNWTSTDNDWLGALKISDYYAAIEIVDGLPNEDSSALQTTLDGLIGKINRTDTTSPSAGTLQISNATLNIANELDSRNYLIEQDRFD